MTTRESMQTITVMNREDTLKALANPVERFYVYILHRPDGRPFYVGKGSVVGTAGRERVLRCAAK